MYTTVGMWIPNTCIILLALYSSTYHTLQEIRIKETKNFVY